MGLIAYRIMMVLTAVRHLENVIHKSSSDETVQLVCHEFDYSIAMSICDTLLYHAVFIYQNLSVPVRICQPHTIHVFRH